LPTLTTIPTAWPRMWMRWMVGEVLTPTYSFMGYIPEPSGLINETAPEVAGRLKDEGVDGVVIGTT
ncbi:MAG: hypothetical protein OSB07_06325, partial [Dehalococcoidia bacterium]|nr:hypothetical protein [Dehalococcoidia bacterium]